MLYSIGHNIAGCMPESDVEWYADREDAAARLADVMREYANTDDEATWEALPGDAETARAHGYAVTDEGIDYGDDWPSMLATVKSVLTDDGPDAGSGSWSTCVEDGSGRTIAFWLAAHDFNPEYMMVTDGVRVEVEKIGGGTVGKAYEGTWRYCAHEDSVLLGCGDDFYSGTPMTHRQVARVVLDFLESTN